MNETVLYRERLPKYVFNGTQLRRGSIKLVQWWYRLGAIAIFLGTMYLVFLPKTEHDFSPVWAGIIAAWIGCIILVYRSEWDHQLELDGNIPAIIYEDYISMPPRLHRRMLGKQNLIGKDEIDHIEIMRGEGYQYIASRIGVRWKDAPVGIKLVTKAGKRINLGYKPPSTVKDIVDVLSKHWDVRIVDPGSGMGRGYRYIKDNVIGEYSYDEIMN